MPDDSMAQDEEQTIDRRSAHIAVVCTQKSEIAPLLAKVDRQRKYVDNDATFRGGFIDETIRVAIVEAGPGFARHRQAALTVIAEHNPAWVMSVGFSSPLTSELKQGDLCLASEICDTHGNSLPVNCRITESKRILVRKHVVADTHPRLQSERSELAASTGAGAVDTTSLAAAQACTNSGEAQKGPRFLSVRGIIGGADLDLPDNAVTHLFEPDASRPTGFLGKITGRFRKDPELAAWDKRAEETAGNLNRFLLATIRQLGDKIRNSG